MMIKNKSLKETAEGKDELDLYLNNEEWAYRRLEKIVNDGIAKKWSKRAITFGVAREIYNLKDAFGRLPTTRQERLEIANDFVDALLPDGYKERNNVEEEIDLIDRRGLDDIKFIGNAKVIKISDLPRIGDSFNNGTVVSINRNPNQEGYRIYDVGVAEDPEHEFVTSDDWDGLDGVNTAHWLFAVKPSLKEDIDPFNKERITPEEIDAFAYSYGTTKKEAKEKLKGFSKEARQEIVKGWKQDAKKSFYEESLKEDVDTVVPEKDDAPVLSASTLPVANKLIEAINGEWDTIVLYNNIITELKENNFDDIIPVIQDIVKEENTHVGQLQKALSTISPDTDDIASGEVEAEGQLNESLEECDDCEYFDDIDSEDEFELYRTDVKEIPYGKDQKRIRDRRLVDRDREPIQSSAREGLFDGGERIYEKEIRKALEDGSITKEDIVEYTLKNTPDEMLSGMLNMSSDEIDLYDNGYDSVTDTLYRGDDCYDDLTDVEVNCCMDDIYMKPADIELDICDADLEMGDNLPEEREDGEKLQEFGPVATAVVSAVAPVVADRVMDKILPEEAKEEPVDLKKVIPEADDEPASMEDDLDENAVNMI